MKNKDVYLIPIRDGEEPIKWIWAYDGNFGAAATFPTVYLPYKSGQHEVTFTIIDPEGEIVFDGSPGQGPQSNAGNAIWIMPKQTGTNKLPGVQQNDQIVDIDLDKDDTQLSLKDKNKGDPVTFTYQLNFRNSDTNQPVTAIDPDLKNGGGGEEISYSAIETVLIALGVATAAALLSLWAQRLR